MTGGFSNPSITVGGKCNFQPGRRDMRDRKKLPSLKLCHIHQTRQWHFGTRPDGFAYQGEQTQSKTPPCQCQGSCTHSPLQLQESGNGTRACPGCCSPCPLSHGLIQCGAREEASTSQGCSSEEREVKRVHSSV